MAKEFDQMEDSNRSANPSIHQVSDPGRRVFVRGGVAGALAGLFGPLAAGALAGSWTPMSSAGLDPAHVAWCGRHFAMLREGGLWAVPRSGLVFAKRAGRFVLVKAMPWEPAMAGTLTAEQLREWQEVDFQDIRVHFGAAGIDVVREDPDGTD